jgi:pimeloyl-ACP methyl ester carboxylesterase
VGIGKKPPLYLKSGDTIAVSVTSLGTLTNRVADPTSRNPITKQVQAMSRLQPSNAAKSIDVTSLTTINNKPLFYKNTGEGTGPPVIFVHGLGSSNEYFSPLIQSLKLQISHSLHLFDFEGHGLSPTSPLSKLSISSLAEDLDGIFLHANVDSGATIIAQSMGCFVAVQLALSHPGKVSKLILLGPPASPLSLGEGQAARHAMHARADTARTKSMAAIVDDVVAYELSERTKASNPLAVAAVRMSVLGQDPEGCAKACTALAEAEQLDFEGIEASVLIVTGSNDYISPPSLAEVYAKQMQGGASVKVLEDIGHWHIFEDTPGVAKAVEEFML